MYEISTEQHLHTAQLCVQMGLAGMSIRGKHRAARTCNSSMHGDGIGRHEYRRYAQSRTHMQLVHEWGRGWQEQGST